MKTPVRKSLLRKIAWLGGDRRLVGFMSGVLVILFWTMFSGLGFMYGLTVLVPGGLFVAFLWVARKMNAADPWMLDVVIRQFKYKKYYAAKGDLGTEHPQIRDFV